MSEPLVEFLRVLTRDPALRAEFSADPAGVLAVHAGGRVAPRQVHDALVRIREDEALGRGFDRGADDRQIPPPPPPEYFADHDAAGYLDNYVAGGFDLDGGLRNPVEQGVDAAPQVADVFDQGTDVTAVDLGGDTPAPDLGADPPPADHGAGTDHPDFSF
jgi:hypothetical protein